MRPHQQARACSGLILGGGLARRLGGRDKGRMRLGANSPQQNLRLQKLLRQRSRQVYMASGARRLRGQTQRCRSIRAPQYLGRGPLEGLAAGARALRSPWVWVLPVDSAIRTTRDLDRLAYPRVGRGRYAVDAAGNHSLVMLLRRRDLLAAETQLAAGSQRVARFLRTIGACPISLSARALHSLNCPEDWRQLRRRRLK